MSLPGKSGVRALLSGLGIRASFMLGLGAMAVFMLVVVFTSLATSAGLLRDVGNIVDEQLPATLASLSAARAMDRLAATGSSLMAVRSVAERDAAVQRVTSAQLDLQQPLTELLQGIEEEAADELIGLRDELQQNLTFLQHMADERIALIEAKQQARGLLLANLQSFQQQLTYRVRILEGDSDVLRLLLTRPTLPMAQITTLTAETSALIPISRFYAEIEAIGGRLLSASQDPALSALELSEQVISHSLNLADSTLSRVPQDIALELRQYFDQLQDQIEADEGLLSLHRRELLLLAQGELLNQNNQQIIARVDVATTALLNRELMAIDQAGDQLALSSQNALSLLLLVTFLGIVGMAAYFYLHVRSHLIVRLDRLSQSMQMIVAGKYDIELPARGADELGRLGNAVHQFHKVALEAIQRESELQKLNKRLEQLSISDSLTGLANRRRFDEVLPAEWSRAARARQSMAVLMIDVDYFKPFNDRYGHQAGDECLKQIAAVLKGRITRPSDLAARYGGEEFSVVLAHCNIDGANVIAEQIRQEIESLQIKHADSQVGVVTVSIGAAAITPSSQSSADELIRCADQALYKAKETGRNRVAENLEMMLPG